MTHKDADKPDELTRWIWDKYVGVPVAGDAWSQEYEHLLDRVRRMDRSSFTKGLHEGANQIKGLRKVLTTTDHAWEPDFSDGECAGCRTCGVCGTTHQSAIQDAELIDKQYLQICVLKADWDAEREARERAESALRQIKMKVGMAQPSEIHAIAGAALKSSESEGS